MKKIIFITLLITLLNCAFVAFASPPSEKYQLLLADEFLGDALDTTIWDWRAGTPYGGKNLKENVRIQDGMLYLDFRKTDGFYSGGGVLTNFNLPYGYYETRAKIYGATGGLHSSFWISGGNSFTTRPENYPVNNTILEIDGFEIDSHAPNRLSHGTIYWWNERESRFRDYYTEQDFSADYFVMGMEWLPDRVNFYLDGKLINTDDRLNVYGPGYFWLTAVAMPDSVSDLIDDSKADETGYFGSSEYDYFRYYQMPLKNENLLGNGNFEYDRAAKTTAPFCYVTKGNTEASATMRGNAAYEGLYCLRHTSDVPYEVSTGQEFNYLVSGNYTFSGKFKGTGDFTKARMVIYAKDGSVLVKKDIPAAEEWISLTIKDVYVDGYAYVAIESSSNGGTELLIDDLSFYTTEGEVYDLQNEPDYLLYTDVPSKILMQIHNDSLISYTEITKKSAGWSDNSSLATPNIWAGQGNYAIWQLPVAQTGEYNLDIQCLYANNNAEYMQCTVTVNDGEPTVHTIPTNTGKSYYYPLGKLQLQAGDTITVRVDATDAKTTRVSYLCLMPSSTYAPFSSLTFAPDEDIFLYQATVRDWGEFTPYKQDGKYYLPYAKLSEFLDINIDNAEDFISEDVLTENTPYRLIDAGDAVLITDFEEDFDTAFLSLCRMEMQKACSSPMPTAAVLSEDTASGAVTFDFSEAFLMGNWTHSSLDSGSVYATGEAIAVWECAAPQEGTYALQFRSVQHENSTPLANIHVLAKKQLYPFTVNQQTGVTGWHAIGTYDLKAGEKIVVALTSSFISKCLRAKEIRLVPVKSASPLYKGDEMAEDAITFPFSEAEMVGTWSNSSIGSSMMTTGVDAKATFTLTAPKSGRYAVEVYSVGYENGAVNTNIVYTSASDFKLYSLNQQATETGWYEAANCYFEQGETATVSISKATGGYLRVRDVRLVPISAEPILLQSGEDVILGLQNNRLPCDTVLLGEYDADGFLVNVKAAPSASPVQFVLDNPENSFKLFFWDEKFSPLLENK